MQVPRIFFLAGILWTFSMVSFGPFQTKVSKSFDQKRREYEHLV